MSNERSRNGTKQNNSKCFDRKQYQNQANLVHIKTERDGKSNSNLKFCLLNAQSVKNKYQTINEFILDEKIDICSITETWLHSNDTQVSNDLCPDGFEIIQKSRDSKQNNFVIKQRGGGVAVVCRQSFNAKLIKSKKDYESFEYMIVSIDIRTKPFHLVAIYRPPSLSKSLFLDEFGQLITDNFLSDKNVLICGDFNINTWTKMISMQRNVLIYWICLIVSM